MWEKIKSLFSGPKLIDQFKEMEAKTAEVPVEAKKEVKKRTTRKKK